VVWVRLVESMVFRDLCAWIASAFIKTFWRLPRVIVDCDMAPVAFVLRNKHLSVTRYKLRALFKAPEGLIAVRLYSILPRSYKFMLYTHYTYIYFYFTTEQTVAPSTNNLRILNILNRYTNTEIQI